MGKSSAAGQKAYKSVRSKGGKKEEALIAQKMADNAYYERVRLKQFSKSEYNSDEYKYDSDKNSGRWHTSEDF